MLAETAIVFAILGGQPTTVEYRGPLSVGYIPKYATKISFDEARRRIERGKTPIILFAMVGGPVKRATKKQALGLLDKWTEQLNLKRQGKSAGRITVPDPAKYRPKSAAFSLPTSAIAGGITFVSTQQPIARQSFSHSNLLVDPRL